MCYRGVGEDCHCVLCVLMAFVQMRMRAQSAQNQPKPRRHTLVPNRYVAPTDKRRDDLRWEVRVQMSVPS